ncbi:esterase OVCA2-like [Oppia nitens]|uniref:esterase OVCA2-like n=1 Tax=Oppia nitens TaxID=1686743 RepID=UPI0023DC1EEA|nr:esterase OVCA2-like [Oppia nitens]
MTSSKGRQQLPPLKVLCLHGYRQTSVAFKSKSGGFRKLLKNKLDFVFIDGPHLVPTGPQNPDGTDDSRSWWFSDVDPDYFSSAQESDICKGFDQSVDLIRHTFETQGPFDGILGFSQGSALVALICCLKQLKEFNYDLKFVVLVAGFQSLSASHLKLFDRLDSQLIDIPSLHIIGESDQVIAKEKSVKLSNIFKNPYIVYHSGGHLVPSNSSNRQKDDQTIDYIICEYNDCNIFLNLKSRVICVVM